MTELEARTVIAENLKRFRASNVMTQLELGLEVGVAQSTIASLEKAQKTASIATLCKLGVVMGVEPFSFLVEAE